MKSIVDTLYAKFVGDLAKPGADIAAQMTGPRAHLLHMTVGVSGEAGELLDAVKKHVIYGKALDHENVVEELGDIEFYLQGIRNGLGLERTEIIEANMRKLGVRYSEGYSDAAAQDRADKA
jgi:NTP pyrophosphatase (non-canonical NTP hydrolase)